MKKLILMVLAMVVTNIANAQDYTPMESLVQGTHEVIPNGQGNTRYTITTTGNIGGGVFYFYTTPSYPSSEGSYDWDVVPTDGRTIIFQNSNNVSVKFTKAGTYVVLSKFITPEIPSPTPVNMRIIITESDLR